MKDKFTAPLRALGEFEQIQKDIFRRKGIVDLDGCLPSQKLHMAYGLPEGKTDEGRLTRLIVTYDEIRAGELLKDFTLYDKNAAIYPARDLIFYQADIKGNLLTKQRMDAIKRMADGEGCTIIASIEALMEHMPPPECIKKNIFTVKKGDEVKENELAAVLSRLGYEKVARVEDAGQFALRGGIIDIFSMTKEAPYRIELWGDEVESLRCFDCESQRSIEELSEISVYPAGELILTKEEKLEGLLRIEKEAQEVSERLRAEFKTEEAHRIDTAVRELRESITCELDVPLDGYLPYFYTEGSSILDLFDKDDTVIFIDEPARIAEKSLAVENEFKESMLARAAKGYALPAQSALIYPAQVVFAHMERFACCAMSTILQKQSLYKPHSAYHISAKSINAYNNSFESLVADLKRYRKNKFSVMLVCPSPSRAKRMAEDLTGAGVSAFYSDDDDRVLKKSEIMVIYGHVSKGFEYPLSGFVMISEGDIFGGAGKSKKRRRKKFSGMGASGLLELSVGDYVVHESHGLGIYQGIEHIETDHVTKDYMKISYAGGGNLYIPATGFDVIQKYASADSKKPKLNKLGGSEWTRTRERVRQAVEEIAKDLVELYAKRLKSTGFVYGEDTVWQKEFEELFPYEETEDQLQAIEDTKRDMQSAKIMDRLICGDVGYGKTEIALRAAFKAVQENKQVAFLVPTTILASQHYNNFVQRLMDFPVKVEMLSRFRSAAQQKKIVSDMKKGMVDIVIGTHRMLSKDVEFKDLGLLVIDEEQRFGVAHKEKIKKLRENVDVLSLSATPIPRTLHMSLVGIRDMSVLEEPPEERMPVQTFVMEYNEEMIREAVSRELSRGGQVYYVYNRINTIAEVTESLRALVPDAQIEYAHGRMKEEQLEELMSDFINGEIDVLVSTTIIETGLDIPNVNTIIVHDSDRMGLSQLYQLRGRVGRSNRTAYAFLMYKRDKLLREEAEKRLSAIREFTDLGSGFRIAMKDLEIRGAGNILGKSQHGHMEAVGYELYCKLLNEAVRREKTPEGASSEKPDIDFTTQIDADIDAFIPSQYIRNESMKLDMYKRISVIESDGEALDMEAELDDRFGRVPQGVRNLIKISLLRVKAHSVYIEELKANGNTVRLIFNDKAPIDPAALVQLLSRYDGALTFKNAKKPMLVYDMGRGENDLFEKAGGLLDDMKETLL